MQTSGVNDVEDGHLAEVAQVRQLSEADTAAFDHAMDQQKKRELGAAFAHRCLNVASRSSVALILSLLLNGYFGWLVAHPPIKYFTTENGRIIRVNPTDKPAYSQTDVSKFGADTIRESFTLDFVHYRDQTTKLGERYSEQGYSDYYTALNTSNVLAAVKKQRMNLSVEVGPGVIRSRGAPGGVVTWEFQYPVTLKLEGQTTSSPAQRYIYTLRIQRVEEDVKNAGLEVTQVITSNAN
jgi:intracellular multiplication protein IcmL